MLAEDSQRQRGRQLSLRYAAVQLVVSALVALGLGLSVGWGMAKAVLTGGVITTTGQVIFGWLMFQPGIAPIEQLHRALWRAEAGKWLWMLGALALAFTTSGLLPLGLIIGVISAQLGFGLGLRWLRA